MEVKVMIDKLKEFQTVIAEMQTQLEVTAAELDNSLTVIREGDFAFYCSNAYVILRNNGRYATYDKFVCVRFGYKHPGDEYKSTAHNQISWVGLNDAEWFSSHSHDWNHEKIRPDLCDLSQLQK